MMPANGIVADLRMAFRQLRRNSVLPLTCVAVLAFGLGANTAVFSALYKVVLKPLPYPHPEQLVAVHDVFPGLGIGHTQPSAVDYLDLRQHRELFSEAGVYYFLDLTRTGVDRPEKVNAIAMTSSLLRAFGVPPLMGRFFNADEERFHGPHAVVIGEAYWRSAFGADPQILTRSLQLDGETYPIVGVMPASFLFPTLPTQMWVPVPANLDRGAPGAASTHYLRMIARLAPGVTVDQGSQRIDQLGRAMAANDPQEHPIDPSGWRFYIAPLNRDDDGTLRRWMAILFACVSCLLLIVCSNVAGLLLVRSTSRQFELSVRMALGAGRMRIARMIFSEVLILSIAGGAGALLLARALVGLLTEYGPAGPVEIEAPVYWFGLALTLVAGLACGLYPALSASRSDAVESLKQGGTQRTASRGQQRGRQGLIVAQVAIATALLICGGLLTHSLLRLLDVPLGFDPANILSLQTQLHGTRYQNPAERANFYGAVMEQIRAVPGVDAASTCSLLPFGYGEDYNTFQIVGKPKPKVALPAVFNTVMPGYFATMRIALLRGGVFTDQDRTDTEPVAIVDESLANRHFAGEDPVGRQIDMFGRRFTIAGVVGAVKTTALDVETSSQIYFPAAQSSPSSLTLVVRSRLPQAALVGRIADIVHGTDKDEAVFEINRLQDFVDKSFRARRFVALLIGGFAIAGALLAALGLYGLLSYTVAQRHREAGIRMVLGARPGEIAWLLCARGVTLMAGGAALGSVAALIAYRLIASQMYGTHLEDPATWMAALAVIGLSSAAACAIPAWKASRLDPGECLRVE